MLRVTQKRGLVSRRVVNHKPTGTQFPSRIIPYLVRVLLPPADAIAAAARGEVYELHECGTLMPHELKQQPPLQFGSNSRKASPAGPTRAVATAAAGPHVSDSTSPLHAQAQLQLEALGQQVAPSSASSAQPDARASIGATIPAPSYYVKLRPGIREFLLAASELFELHVRLSVFFCRAKVNLNAPLSLPSLASPQVDTFGSREYADAVVKLLDPSGILFAGTHLVDIFCLVYYPS